MYVTNLSTGHEPAYETLLLLHILWIRPTSSSYDAHSCNRKKVYNSKNIKLMDFDLLTSTKMSICERG